MNGHSDDNRKSTIIVDGAFGQDGEIIIGELCKTKNTDIHVLTHRQELPTIPNLWDSSRIQISYWDSISYTNLCALIRDIAPTEYINLAAHHHAAIDMVRGFDQEQLYGYNYRRSAMIISSLCRHAPSCHFHYASSSLIYTASCRGHRIYPSSLPNPSLPYGVAKARVMSLVDTYRRCCGLTAAVSVMFNHDSPHKKRTYLLPRIGLFVANTLKAGTNKGSKLHVHNVGATYDLSCAHKVAKKVLHITQSRLEGNFILASGQATTVKDILNWAFSYVSLRWEDFVEYEKDDVTPYLLGCPSIPQVQDGSLDRHVQQRDLVEAIVASNLQMLTNDSN
jgi:GDPmannose 4,6-dehydratase